MFDADGDEVAHGPDDVADLLVDAGVPQGPGGGVVVRDSQRARASDRDRGFAPRRYDVQSVALGEGVGPLPRHTPGERWGRHQRRRSCKCGQE